MALSQPSSDPRIADLVQAGRVRVGVFPPQLDRDAATSQLQGPWIAVLRALVAHMGLEMAVTELAHPGSLIESFRAGLLDLGSLGFDPTRAPGVEGFTPPFMEVDYTCLLPAGSLISAIAELDRPGRRVAAVRLHASTLALGRVLEHAEQMVTDTAAEAFDLLSAGHVHAWASIRPLLIEYSRALPGSQMLADSYGANLPALVVPQGQAARLAYVSDFVEQARASGLLETLLAPHPGYRPR